MITPIPKRIIQTDRTADLSPLAKGARTNMRLLNPDYEYIFFDNQQVERFIDEQFPQYRSVFDAFTVPIQRYDFFRYLAVYALGGFYFDMDMLLVTPLDDLLSAGCVFPFERLTWSDYLRKEFGMDWEVGNYAFGASMGHPFLRAIIENCIKAQIDPEWAGAAIKSVPWPLREDLFVIYTTGPGLVSRTLAEYLNQGNSIRVLFPSNVCDKNEWNLFGSYGVHLMQSSWRSWKGIKKRLVTALAGRNEARALRLASRIGASRSIRREVEGNKRPH